MSKEVKTEEVKKSSSFVGWIKNAVSAVVGALLSFGVTFGFVTAEQEKTMNEKMGEINKKSESIVQDLKSGNVKRAIETAQAISSDTKVVVETGKKITEQAKGTVTEIKEKITQTKTTEEVKKVEATKANY